MAEIAIVGLDLAKNVFQMQGVDKAGAVVLLTCFHFSVAEKTDRRSISACL